MPRTRAWHSSSWRCPGQRARDRGRIRSPVGSVGGIGGVTRARRGRGAAGVTSLALLPAYNAYKQRHPDEALQDLTLPLLIHLGVWSAAGAAGGLAFGLGLGARGRLAAPILGGVVGAVVATIGYELIGAMAFPAAKTAQFVSAHLGNPLDGPTRRHGPGLGRRRNGLSSHRANDRIHRPPEATAASLPRLLSRILISMSSKG